jgi:enoyl-CoA hydratase/carnithine racemase
VSDDVFTRFKLTYTDSPAAGRLAVMTMDNGRDYRKPNTFGEQALGSLAAALDELESQDDVKGLLLTGKHFIFAVGADLTQFEGMDAEGAREGGRRGHEVFARLQALPFPTLAAINGACMGGGLEIALHCDYRTLSTGAAAIAFPEVFLSIFPAWGGTQLAPRVAGAKNAIDAIVVDALNNNRMMKPQQAFERGFADRLIDSAVFLDESVALLERLVTGDETIDRPGVVGRISTRPRGSTRRWPTPAPSSTTRSTAPPAPRTSRSTSSSSRPAAATSTRAGSASRTGSPSCCPPPRRRRRSTRSTWSRTGRRSSPGAPTRPRGGSRRSPSSAPGSWARSSARCTCSGSRSRS